MSLSPISSPGSSDTVDETSVTATADSPVSGQNDESTTPHDTSTPVTSTPVTRTPVSFAVVYQNVY